MISRRRLVRPAATLLLAVPLAACALSVEGRPTPASSPSTLPAGPAELEPLIVLEVPSGLPRLPDEALDPPAGPKELADVASYAEDPHRERKVLKDFGYRHGWERFWGHGASGPMTGVFVDQFETRGGAGTYAEDLARNDAELYGGVLREDPPDLPGGCRLLVVEEAVPEHRLSGPSAFAWCAHGVFSVGVTAVADSMDDAEYEVRAVLEQQLAMLPPG